MELLITIGAVIFIIIAFCLVKEAISRSESRNRKLSHSENMHEKFQQLNRMAAQMRI